MGFLIYALFFRLAIIATGIVSIVLGYKLFAHGIKCRGETNVDVEAGEFKIRFDSIGSGALFALFGATIIVFMLSQGNPELLIENAQLVTKDVRQPDDSLPNMEKKKMAEQQPMKNEVIGTIQKKKIRGEHKLSTDQEWDKLDKPNVTLSEAAEPFSKIARIWQQEKRTGEAVAMARLAAFYGTGKNKANYLALLGETLLENGDEEKAVIAMQEAADRDPLYRSALAHMQQRSEGKKD